MTALSHAVKWGHLQVADQLLRAGSSPDMTEHSAGHSLLMMACVEGNTGMVELLLQWGADTRYRVSLSSDTFENLGWNEMYYYRVSQKMP